RGDLRGAPLRARARRRARSGLRREGAAREPRRRIDRAPRTRRLQRHRRVGVPALRRRASALQLQDRQRGGVLMDPSLRESFLYDRTVIAEIHRAAREGIYDIRGFGAKRRLPHFDDLLLLGASVSRYPLEGYREKCSTDVVLATRPAARPLELKSPITVAGMRFGALPAEAKEALGSAPTDMGPSTPAGDGG